jgi:hypothetical protein
MRVLDTWDEISENVYKCKRDENEFEENWNDNELSNFDDCERSLIVLEICKFLQTIHTRLFQQSEMSHRVDQRRTLWNFWRQETNEIRRVLVYQSMSVDIRKT